MITRTLLAVFCIVSAGLFVADSASAQDSKKKPKEIVVVGSKVKEVVRDAGTTEETSLNPPALDDRNFKDLKSDEKKGKESQNSDNVSFGVEREMKESGEKGAADTSHRRSVQPAPARPSGSRKPAGPRRPSGAKDKEAPESGED